MNVTEARLSGLQIAILQWLAGETNARRSNPWWGVDWHPSRWGEEWRGASARAVLSRALKRLEERGLVLRQDWGDCRTYPEVPWETPGYGVARRTRADRFPGRTTTVLLLPAGREVVERLTHGKVPCVSHSEEARQ